LPHSFVAPRDKTKIVKIQDVKNQITDFFTYETVNEIALNRPVIMVNYIILSDENGFWFLMAAGLRGPPVA